MNKYVYYIYEKYFKCRESIETKFWDIYQSKKVMKSSNTHFLLESKVENLQKNKESIQIGDNTYVRGELLVYPHSGKISIGDFCYIGVESRIWSAEEIKIGNNVLISHHCDIHDSNDHPINSKSRHEHYKKIIFKGHPRKIDTIQSDGIEIGDDVWIGFGSAIMKGVKIGRNVIVAAHTMVVKDVPENVIVAGNPMRIIKRL